MDGYEYERKCAKMLEGKGFTNITVTPGSGDQGIDIIAYKGTVKYGIQCKYYEGTVGNKAVQEAFAGASYYDCTVAMVITSSTLTKPAHTLAEKLKVEIMENVDAVYLHNASKAHSKAEQERTEQIENQRKSLQENADKIERDLHQQLNEIYSKKEQELAQSISSTNDALNAAIEDTKSEIEEHINNVNSELQETLRILGSVGALRLIKKRTLKQKEQQLQNQILQLKKDLDAPQSDAINQFQNLLKLQQEQFESLNKEHSQQEGYIESAIALYRRRIDSYLRYKFSDKGSEAKLKSQLGDEYFLLEKVKKEILSNLSGLNTFEKMNGWVPLCQYSSHILRIALDKLIQEGRIQSKKAKGETIYIRTYEVSHRMNRTEIIDDWGWNINELPPVPTVENAKQYWYSSFWEDPYTDTNIRKHILTALKDNPNITVAEICKNDQLFSYFSGWAIGQNIDRMVKQGVLCVDKSGRSWKYSLSQ